jgi:hypothetical protein
MWCQGYHQVKLFAGVEKIEIHFRQGYDDKYRQATIDQTPKKASVRWFEVLHLKKEFVNYSEKKIGILF